MNERHISYQQLVGPQSNEPLLPSSSAGLITTEDEFAKEYPVRYDIWRTIEHDHTSSDPLPDHLLRTLQMLNNLDNYVKAHSGRGRRVLREKQLAVFSDTHRFLEQGNTDGYIEAPTGFGKTVLFSEIIQATNQRTLVVVPSRVLVEQTYDSLRRFNPDLDCGRVYSERKETGRQVTITTYQSLVQSNGGVEPADIDLLILDEVHQSLTEHRIDAVSRFNRAVRLGFTATPEYTRDKRVSNLLNNQIHAISLKEAVEAKLLSPFSVYLAETDVDISGVRINANGEFDERELEQAINIYSRNKSAVDLYKQLIGRDPGLSKAVAYCVTIRHAKDVAEFFNAAGIPAAALWSDQDPNERRAIIEAYKRGEIKILTNVNILNEGFDDPDAALCINLRPTRSKVVAKQRSGRILRLDPNNPRKHAVVVDYLDRNEDKRYFQVTFAQVVMDEQGHIAPMQDEFPDVAEQARRDGATRLEDDEFNLQIEGLHVVTSSEEVLRIVSENMVIESTHAPDGWKTLSAFAEESRIGHRLIDKTIIQICDELGVDGSDRNWFQVYLVRGRLRQYLSPEIMDLIKLKLPVLEDYPGFIEVPSGDLKKEFGTPAVSYWKALRRVGKIHPEHFVQRGIGQKWFVDEEGYELLRAYLSRKDERIALQSKQSTSEDHRYLSASALSREFGLSFKAVTRRIRKIQTESPNDVINSPNGTFFITPEAEVKLQALLDDAKDRLRRVDLDIGDRRRVSAIELSKEFGYSSSYVRNRIHRVKEMIPNAVVGGGPGQPFYLSDEGEKLLRDMLSSGI